MTIKYLAEVQNWVPMNPDTGEWGDRTIGELLGVDLLDAAKKKRIRDIQKAIRKEKGTIDRFALVNHSLFAQLELTGSQMRVLQLLIGEMRADGEPTILPNGEMAQRLETTAAVISRATTELVERHVIARGEIRGSWAISPWIAYRGSIEDMRAAADYWPKPTLSRTKES